MDFLGPIGDDCTSIFLVFETMKETNQIYTMCVNYTHTSFVVRQAISDKYFETSELATFDSYRKHYAVTPQFSMLDRD